MCNSVYLYLHATIFLYLMLSKGRDWIGTSNVKLSTLVFSLRRTCQQLFVPGVVLV